MRELRPDAKFFGNAQHVIPSALEINVLAGKWPPLLYTMLLCGVARRPEVNGLAADQHIGLASSVPLREDAAELFEGKAHGMRLRVTRPRLLGHGFHHLAQVGNPTFRAVRQRVPPLESNRCPPALARTLDISHALAGLFALEGSDRFRAHG